MQAMIVLEVILILALLGQIPLLIWFVMGVVCVLIFRNGVSSYDSKKLKEKQE